jgi:shikimate kinase
LDTYIEKKAELSISAIFEMKGEIKFRKKDEALWNY